MMIEWNALARNRNEFFLFLKNSEEKSGFAFKANATVIMEISAKD